MRVKNRKTIWNLSLKSFRASGKRNLIAVVAIVLTTVLFTSLFTIVMSLNESYQTYTFRQIGGYAHGTFKDVTDKQAEEIKGHKKVKAAGERIVAGIIAEGAFARVPAEVSYMDENNTKWSYIDLKEGREPEGEKEIILDDAALELLGVTPELGAEITLTYQVSDKKQNGGVRTDTFTLAGWWEYDPVMPVHYINVSRAYMEQLERDMTGEGLEPFRRDLNVMLSSSLDIDGTMEEIEEDLGYQRDDPGADTYLNYGVNWGYTTAQAAAELDPGLLAAMAAFLLLVIFTGYLIIYNIFQISVTGDIRYYGLLKTIGVTPRQLRRIIRQQALLLCGIGCPLGLIAGWLVGSGLVPVVLARTSLETIQTEVSSSPLIFAASALFAVATVLLSCGRPGRMAAKVSPVEAVKYTETGISSRKERRSSRAGIGGMAFANLGRNKKRTALVVVSLSLSVVLLALPSSLPADSVWRNIWNRRPAQILSWGTRITSGSRQMGRNPASPGRRWSRSGRIQKKRTQVRPGRCLEYIPRCGLTKNSSAACPSQGLKSRLTRNFRSGKNGETRSRYRSRQRAWTMPCWTS